MSVPNSGEPAANARVPSTGSSTQTNSAPVFSAPYSSPRMPWLGNRPRIIRRMSSSAPRSAAVTGVWSDLVSTARSGRAKYGRMRSPLFSASSSMKSR